MRTLSLIYLFVIILCSCRPDRDPPEEPRDPVIGFIAFFDEFGNELSYKPKTYVTVEGSNRSTTMDSSGKFVLYNLPSGPLNLLLVSDGFNTIKHYVPNYVNGGSAPYLLNKENGEFRLCQPSTTSLQNLTSATSSSPSVITLTGNLVPAGTPDKPRGYLIFASRFANVSSINYDEVFGMNDKYFFYDTSEEKGIYASDEATFTRNLKDLPKFGFKKGSTVYFKAYGSSIFTNAFVDVNSNKLTFPNLAEAGSNVVAVVVP